MRPWRHIFSWETPEELEQRYRERYYAQVRIYQLYLGVEGNSNRYGIFKVATRAAAEEIKQMIERNRIHRRDTVSIEEEVDYVHNREDFDFMQVQAQGLVEVLEYGDFADD